MGEEVGSERGVWFTDRYGAEVETDVSVESFSELLAAIAADDGDDEHRSVSVSDQDEWNLEFYPDSVLFENVAEGGGEEGELSGLPHDERLDLARLFIAGDFDALRAKSWS